MDPSLTVKLTGDELNLFKKLLNSIPNTQIPVIQEELVLFREKVITHLEKAVEAKDAPFIRSFRLALRLCDAAERLLKEYPAFSREQKSWVIGAVLYLIQEEDVQSDFDSPQGFDDDDEVMKQVLISLGKPDWLKETP